MKRRKPQSRPTCTKPSHQKLPWPGLKAKDHLTRVVTQAVKEAREARENEAWAESQIVRLLEYVSPQTAMELLFSEARRRRKSFRPFAKSFLNLMEIVESDSRITGFDSAAYVLQKASEWLN
jgi:hypothetical protein